MKKVILTTAVITALLIGCNETKHKHEATETVDGSEEVHQHKSEEMTSDTHSTNAWVADIKLDNGAKWQANSETTEGVDKMLSLVKSSDPKSVADFHNLASKLNDVKNFVIAECTMKGPSHDNLHVFLLPLIEKIEALGDVSTTNEGKDITQSIQENLVAYYNYFN